MGSAVGVIMGDTLIVGGGCGCWEWWLLWVGVMVMVVDVGVGVCDSCCCRGSRMQTRSRIDDTLFLLHSVGVAEL